MKQIEDYVFPKSELCFWLVDNLKRFKLKFYKAFYFHNQRPFTKKLINKFIPEAGIGLELGCGEKTISPVERTILSDAYESHDGKKALAQVFFLSEAIPYKNSSFSFVVTEHMLEHCVSPIVTLKEIHRILNDQGILFLFLPHKERTFDKFRAGTDSQILIRLYEGKLSQENFLETSYADWKTNVLDKGLAQHYKHYSKEIAIEQGQMHFSAWTPNDIIPLLQYSSFDVLETVDFVSDRPDTFLIVAKKRLTENT